MSDAFTTAFGPIVGLSLRGAIADLWREYRERLTSRCRFGLVQARRLSQRILFLHCGRLIEDVASPAGACRA